MSSDIINSSENMSYNESNDLSESLLSMNSINFDKLSEDKLLNESEIDIQTLKYLSTPQRLVSDVIKSNKSPSSNKLPRPLKMFSPGLSPIKDRSEEISESEDNNSEFEMNNDLQSMSLIQLEETVLQMQNNLFDEDSLLDLPTSISLLSSRSMFPLQRPGNQTIKSLYNKQHFEKTPFSQEKSNTNNQFQQTNLRSDDVKIDSMLSPGTLFTLVHNSDGNPLLVPVVLQNQQQAYTVSSQNQLTKGSDTFLQNESPRKSELETQYTKSEEQYGKYIIKSTLSTTSPALSLNSEYWKKRLSKRSMTSIL